MNIQDKLRCSSVKRWHIVATSAPQTVAEHSFNVAMITKEIALRSDHTEVAANRMVAEALEHDVEEVLTGDIPSPAKEETNPGPMTIVKIADLMDAFVFIAGHYVDRHGFEVTHHCKTQLEEAIGEMHESIQRAALSVLDDMMVGEYTIKPRFKLRVVDIDE